MKQGKKLEIYVAELLKKAFQDKTIRPSKASGGGNHNSELGDIYNNSGLIIECKDHKVKSEQSNIIFEYDVWKKLLNEIPIGMNKIPMYIKRQNNEEYVMLALKDLCYLIKQGGNKCLT